MYEAQQGHCAGCNDKLIFDRTTHVDHCHTSGRVRGLLCESCNNALKLVKDNVTTLVRLSKYVQAAP